MLKDHMSHCIVDGLGRGKGFGSQSFGENWSWSPKGSPVLLLASFWQLQQQHHCQAVLAPALSLDYIFEDEKGACYMGSSMSPIQTLPRPKPSSVVDVTRHQGRDLCVSLDSYHLPQAGQPPASLQVLSCHGLLSPLGVWGSGPNISEL